MSIHHYYFFNVIERYCGNFSMDRLLQALNCPFREDININSRKHIVILVRWLEDRKIREYEVEDRNKLLGDDNGDDIVM